MSQIVHIFRKDARHYWIEILASLTLLGAYAWREPRSWNEGQMESPGVLDFLWRFVTPLVPIAWCFLIVRVVHDERLVGDRQFWVTRPYNWKELLAAKFLFVLMFINLPALIVGVILLAEGGFRPGSYVLGLLWMQLLLALILMLPGAATAAITASIPQVLLVVLAALMYLIGVASLFSVVPNAGMSSASSIPGTLSSLVSIGGCVTVVLWQYARRRVRGALWVIIGAAFVIVMIFVATPYSVLVARAYPPIRNGQQAPVELSLGPTVARTAETPEGVGEAKEVQVNIPLQVTGMAQGTVTVVDGTLFGIQAADGTRWSSGWQSNGSALWPDRERAGVGVEVPRKFFHRAEASSAKVHISLALTVYREENSRSIEVPRGEFQVPGVGICSTPPHSRVALLQCRAPMRRPAVIASIDTSTITCPPTAGKPPLPPGVRITAEYFSGSSGPAEMGISPIQTPALIFWNWVDVEGKFSNLGICPGTPVAFSTPVIVERVRQEVEFNGLRLQDYAERRELGDGQTGYSIFFSVP